jgi:DNA-binding response OmpR family regulator
VWGDEQAASRNVVEVYVGYVRRKLDGVGAGHVLKTVRGYGYIVESP